MVHCSKILLNVWLLAGLVFSIPFTIAALKFYALRGFVTTWTCFVNVVWIPLAYGLCMFMLSIIGIFGSICRFRLLQTIFILIADFILIYSMCVLLFSLFIMPSFPPAMAWASVTNNVVPLNVVYPPMMQDILVNEHKWSHIEDCLDNRLYLCDSAHNLTDDPLDPHSMRVYTLLIQGCCYPPSRCGLVRKNSSEYQWEAPKTMNASFSNDTDCERWTKIGDGKCYDCEICKAGYLAKIHIDWKGVGTFHFLFMMFMIIATIFTGCGAFSELDYHR